MGKSESELEIGAWVEFALLEEAATSFEELVAEISPVASLGLESLHAENTNDDAAIADNKNPLLFKRIRIPPSGFIC
ncbi:hypothetical protein IKQ19_08070 [Candidatus Saccharibacteria bacterium]|nr:hypothetical protein [Candidatus Saccharibacteria bacterium]